MVVTGRMVPVGPMGVDMTHSVSMLPVAVVMFMIMSSSMRVSLFRQKQGGGQQETQKRGNRNELLHNLPSSTFSSDSRQPGPVQNLSYAALMEGAHGLSSRASRQETFGVRAQRSALSLVGLLVRGHPIGWPHTRRSLRYRLAAGKASSSPRKLKGDLLSGSPVL